MVKYIREKTQVCTQDPKPAQATTKKGGYSPLLRNAGDARQPIVIVAWPFFSIAPHYPTSLRLATCPVNTSCDRIMMHNESMSHNVYGIAFANHAFGHF